jgi:hypothetical protein
MNYIGSFNENRYSFLKLSFQLLAAADRVGILAEPLHNYYLSQKGEVRNAVLRFNRLDHFANICPILRQFLMKKCGYISRDNEKFILERYLKTVYDYLPVVFKGDDDLKKLLFIRDVVALQNTKEAFASPLVSPELKANFAVQVSAWLREAIKNKTLEKPSIVGDKGGHFGYFASISATGGYDYAVYDLYTVKGDATVLNILLELQKFLGGYQSER